MSLFQEQSKWQDKNIPKLIELIKSYPVLWDPQNKDYKNPKLRDAAFTEIGRNMNLSADEIRKKYRILRTQYVREVRYLKTRGYGSGWVFFESLKFLSVPSKENRKKANWDELLTEDSQDQIDQVQSPTKATFSDMDIYDSNQYFTDYLDESVDNINFGNEFGFNDDFLNDEIQPVKKRQRQEPKPNSNEAELKTKENSTLLVMKESRKERDEYTIFGEGVACELRALKNRPQLQQSLKCSILQAILDVNKALQTEEK